MCGRVGLGFDRVQPGVLTCAAGSTATHHDVLKRLAAVPDAVAVERYEQCIPSTHLPSGPQSAEVLQTGAACCQAWPSTPSTACNWRHSPRSRKGLHITLMSPWHGGAGDIVSTIELQCTATQLTAQTSAEVDDWKSNPTVCTTN